jgi:hypothetical protein
VGIELLKGVSGSRRTVVARAVRSMAAAACVVALAGGCGSGALSGPGGDESPDVGATGGGGARGGREATRAARVRMAVARSTAGVCPKAPPGSILRQEFTPVCRRESAGRQKRRSTAISVGDLLNGGTSPCSGPGSICVATRQPGRHPGPPAEKHQPVGSRRDPTGTKKDRG